MNETTFKSLLGNEITIRETTGADEALLSNLHKAERAENIPEFIAAIITKALDPLGNPTVITPSLVQMWPSNEKYFVLLKSRIHSLGKELRFKIPMKDKRGREQMVGPFVEDLSRYDWDFYQGPPNEGVENFEDKPKLYPTPTTDFITDIIPSSGKEYRFKLFSSLSERFLLQGNEETQNNTDMLLARSIEMKFGNEWRRLENLSVFTSKDMAHIRKTIKIFDPVYRLSTEVQNPFTKEISQISIMHIPDFFYPEES